MRRAQMRPDPPVTDNRSPQLTIFTAAPVIAAEPRFVPILGVLAGQAEPDARDGIAARLRNLGSAFGAVCKAGSSRQTALRTADRVLHGRVDLLLHRALFCPTRRH